MNPLISVIVPIYNAENHLRECIESILNQTYGNLEVLLVNDGSQDGSLDICYDYKKMDKRISVINRPHSGVSAARNAGIRAAQGDYVGFVDSDDSISCRMYHVLLKAILDNNADLCAQTQYTIRGFEERSLKTNVMSRDDALRRFLLLRFPTSLWAYLYSRQIIRGLFLNENLHFFEDFEYNFRVLLRCTRISLCRETLYNYRASQGSINSQSINDKRMSCLGIYKLVKEICEANNGNRNLLKYLAYSRSHFLVSVILSLVKSENIEEDQTRYSPIIQREAKTMLMDVLPSRYVPLEYKCVILAAATYPSGVYRLLSSYKRWKSDSR